MAPIPRPKNHWRQKGLAAIVAGAMFWPVINGVVQEKAPEGIFAALNRSQPIETQRGPTTLENRVGVLVPDPTGANEHAAPDFTTFDYRTRAVEPTPKNAYRLLTSLLNLGPALEPIGRVAAQNGVPENLLYTLVTLESKGGAVLIPHEYPQTEPEDVEDSTPAGYFHAKLTSLEEAINGAGSARSRLANLDFDNTRGWPSIEEARASLPESTYERFLEGYSSERRAHIALQLATQVPEGPIDDRFDPEQATRGAIAYIALIDAHLQAEGGETPSLAQVVALYTGGHNDADLAADADDDAVGRLVANTRGERYARDAEQMHVILDAYGSIDRALAAAHELTDFHERRPDATEEILGSLYVMAASDPDATDVFDAYMEARRREDRTRWIAISDIWSEYSAAMPLREAYPALSGTMLRDLQVLEAQSPGAIGRFDQYRASVSSHDDMNEAYASFRSLEKLGYTTSEARNGE